VKKRVFYVINLDRSRIIVLGVLITGFLLISFATGYRFGTNPGIESRDLGAQMQAQEEALMDPSRQGLERSLPADEPALQPPTQDKPEPARSTREQLRDSAPAKAPERPAESRRPAEPQRRTREPERRPQTAPREEKNQRNRAPEPRRDRAPARARREEKQAPATRGARNESRQSAPVKEDRHARPERTDAQNRREAKPDQAVKLEPEKGLRMANSGGNPRPTGDSAAPAKSSTGSMRSLQLGSFTSRVAAGRMESELKKQGFESAVVSVNGKFAVRVGRSASDSDIAKLERQLKQKNYNPVRVNLP